MNALDERRERFFRDWSDAYGSFDRDRVRNRLLAGHGKRKSGMVSRAREGLWFVAATMAAAAAIAMWARPLGVLSFTTPSGKGEVGAWLATDQSSEMPIAFSENTKIILRQDSRGRVETVGQKGAHFLIERGGIHAEVVHRTETDWRFLAGPFEVRVTGTALNVAWDPAREQLSVRVDHGSVVVHGPYLGDDQVVRTGELCLVDVPSKSMRLLSDADGYARDTHAADSPPAVTADPAPVPHASSNTAPSDVHPAATAWSDLEGQGDYEGAYAAVQRAGAASLYRLASVDSLLELAKVGQLSGHRDMQRDALLAVRRRFAGSRQASLAAYELGRTTPAVESAGWFEAYLAEQPAGPLAREASGRLLEADSLAHNEPAARDAARRYLARYPDGPHAALARRALDAQSP
jgi:transmembrane sensor